MFTKYVCCLVNKFNRHLTITTSNFVILNKLMESWVESYLVLYDISLNHITYWTEVDTIFTRPGL